MVPRFIIYRVICDRLETIDCVSDAGECFRQMVEELGEQDAKWVHGEQSYITYRCRLCNHCILDFKHRCLGKLESCGDVAMNAEQHDNAIFQYSLALSLNPSAPQGFFIKRSKAHMAKGLWEEALNDANEVCPLVLRKLVLVDT